MPASTLCARSQADPQQSVVLQVLESSSDGTLTHPALLKDRVTSPAGTTIAGAPSHSMRHLPRSERTALAGLTCPAVCSEYIFSGEASTGNLGHNSHENCLCAPAGLAELESAGLRGIVMRAVRAAAKRSEDMG